MYHNIGIYLYNEGSRQYMSFYNSYTMIYSNMQVYPISKLYIFVYTRIDAYIRISKQFEKLCINTGFKPVISCTLSAGITTSVNTSVLPFALTGTVKISVCSLLSCVTWQLVSDVRRGTRNAARAGHDVAGPGLHLEVLVLAAACQ